MSDDELEESTILTSGYSVVMPSTTAGRFFIVNQKPLDNDAEQLLQVYTNEKEVYVTASADMMIEQIIVYDANGQVIYSEGDIFQNQFSFHLPERGIYVMRILTNTGVIIQKIYIN